MAVNPKHRYIPDKCNPPHIDMGTSTVFASPMPGLNNNAVHPFGWTEYEASFRPQYIPDPKPCIKPCREISCRPRGGDRRNPPREYANKGKFPRSTICQICHIAKGGKGCLCRPNFPQATDPPIPPPWEECREKITVLGPDSVRTLLVKGELKREHPFVLSNADYQRIIDKAQIQDKKAIEEECERKVKEKQEMIAACRRKADELRLIDQYRMKAELSPEAQEMNDETIGRAKQILKEDEPEVRTINKVILAAKVGAIREAQLQEAELIRCERAEEERRLGALMKQDGEKALIKDDDKEVEALEQRKKDLMASIQAQLDEREAMQYLDKKMKEKEAEELRALWEKHDLEEIQKKTLEQEKRVKLGIELIENQMLTVERLRREKEIDKALDKEMLDFHKKKDAADARLEADKRVQKKMKELAVKQVLDTQKRTGDSKSLRDELRAKRHWEMQEREWRRKEREAAIQKREKTLDLKNGILQQMQQKQNWIVEQAAYEKAMYDKLFNVQDTQMEEERKKQEEREMRRVKYKGELEEQIHQWKLARIRERKDYFVEGLKLRKALGQREQELKGFMEEKIQDLRSSGMPEKYIVYIQRAVDEELKPDYQKKISKS